MLTVARFTAATGESSQLGQLGVKTQIDYPSVIPGLAKVHVVRVACGGAHNLAITRTL